MKWNIRILGTVLLVVALSLGPGVVTAVEPLPIEVDAPSSATVGETVEVSATVSPPDVPGDHSKEATVTLNIDGSEVESQTVTVEDGSSATVDFSHEFSSGGEKSITIEGSTTFLETSYSGSASTTIDVEQDLPSSVSVSADAPGSVTIGEEASVDATVELPSVSSDVSGDFVVSLSANGEPQSEETVTVGDGSTETVTLPVTFDETGDQTVTIEASGSVGGEELSASTEKSIAVTSEEVGALSLDATVPETVSAGDTATVDTTLSLPDARGTDASGDVTVSVSANGEQKASEQVTLQDGGTRDVTLNPTLSSAGDTTLTIEASGEIAGEDVSASVSRTVSVEQQQPTIGDLSLDASAPTSVTANTTAPIDASLSLPDAGPSAPDATVTISASVDSDVIAQQEATVSPEQPTDVTLQPAFSSPGDKTVVIEVSSADTSLSATVRETITVEQQELTVGDLSLDAEVPETATVGTPETIDAGIELPNAGGPSVTGDVTVTLSANGQQKDAQEATLQGSTREQVELSPTFTSAGETTVTIRVSGTVAGTRVSTSTERTILVEQPTVDLGDLSVSATAPSSVSAGETATIDTTIAVPAASQQSDTANLTVAVRANDEEKDSTQASIRTGESETITLSPTLTQSGDTTLTIEVTGQAFSQPLSASVTKSITVDRQQRATPELSLSPSVPRSITTGNETTISATVASLGLPDSVRTTQATVTLTADGATLGQKTVSLTENGTEEVSFTEAIRQEWETNLTLTASATVAGQNVSESVSRTVQVRNPSTQTTVEGVALPVPGSLEDEVAQYRADASLGDEVKAFVLAERDSLSLVFSTAEPRKGRANVTGQQLDQSLAADDLQYQVIVATDTVFETVGEETTISEVRDDTDAYRREVVRIDATHQRLTTLTDPDGGDDITVSTTVGSLVANPRTAQSTFDRVGRYAGRLSQHPNQTTVERIFRNGQRERLVTFTFETGFWTNTEATTDGIVIDPAGSAYEFLSTYRNTSVVPTEENTPLLYVVDRSLDPEQMGSVADIKTQASALDGEVVSVNARFYGTNVSVQETLEHATGEPCGEDVLTVQTPQGPVCTNVVQDELFHAGIAWNTVPQSRSDVLFVVGVSSRHQDTPTTETEGRYRITGEVVSTSRINESLPEGSILLASDLTRTDDIDYCAVGAESRSIIENQTATLRDWAGGQIASSADRIDTGDIPTARAACGRVQSLAAGDSQSVGLPDAQQSETGVEEVSLTANETLEDVQVDATAVSALPETVDQPPGDPVRTVNISTSAPDDALSNATFRMRLSRDDTETADDVAVYRYDEVGWDELEYSVVAESESSLTLRVSTPGFSYFAVTNNGTENESATSRNTTTRQLSRSVTTTEGSGPGFGLLLALVALTLGIVAKLRRET